MTGAGRGSGCSGDPVDVTAALVDPETGLCATEARFTEAHVYEHVAAQSAGRWTTAEITTMASDFLAAGHVVRLSAGDHRRPPEWSTVAHRALEDAVLEDARRTAHLERHAWRHQRIAALDAELDRHWAAATLGAVRQDDPLWLAFQVEATGTAIPTAASTATTTLSRPSGPARRHGGIRTRSGTA